MHASNFISLRTALIGVAAFCLVVAGCRQGAPPPVGRELPSGIGVLQRPSNGGDDLAGKDELVPGIDYCSYAACSGIDDFVFFIWGGFHGGAAGTTSKNETGLQFQGHLINEREMGNVEYTGNTKDGRTGQVTIDGKQYDLAEGTLFLVSARQDLAVKQLNRDLTRFRDAEHLFQELSKSDHEIADFFRLAEPTN